MTVPRTQNEAEHPEDSSTATWTYNSLGQLSAQGGLGFGTAGATYAYNAATGLRKTMTADLKLGEDIDERDEYYGESRVQRAGPAADPDWGTYTYNRHGDLKTATLGGTRTYGYAAQHRLRWTEVDEGTRRYYLWDEANDRRIAEGPGVLSGDTWSAPEYGDCTVFYGYDEAGALTHWEDNAVASDKDKADYTYDAEGQRTRTTLIEDYGDTAANQTWTTTDYLYDGLALVSETITKTVGEGPTNVWQLFYFYDAAGRPWAAVDRKLSAVAGSTHSFYLVTDDRGDVVELLEADHIAFGAYRYDVYGRPTETTWRTTDTTAMDDSWMEPITADRSLLRYAGYSYDAHSELYYLQRRYYDAILRQFLSRDPLKSDGTESPYQYCRGNPVAGVDPWGLYVTASGGSTNTEFYFPQSGKHAKAGNWRPHSVYLERDYFASLYHGLNSRANKRFTGKIGGLREAAAAFGTAIAVRAPMTMGAAPKVNPWVIGGAALAAGILAGADVYDQYVEGVQAEADAAAYRGLVESAADAARIEAAAAAQVKAEEMHAELKDRRAYDNRTTAVLVTDKGVIVAGSGTVKLTTDQIGARPEGAHVSNQPWGWHAEANALWDAATMGAKPLSIGVSPRPFCPGCAGLLVWTGATITTPYTAAW
jgi:RHS repeat-associated protein